MGREVQEIEVRRRDEYVECCAGMLGQNPFLKSQSGFLACERSPRIAARFQELPCTRRAQGDGFLPLVIESHDCLGTFLRDADGCGKGSNVLKDNCRRFNDMRFLESHHTCACCSEQEHECCGFPMGAEEERKKAVQRR